MSLASGARLGPYEILSPLGAGGMGEVYRARDSRLGREVALKLLPPAVATDPERLARFDREARLLASLNHPNVAAIYGLEESGGSPFLVLELVPGETLAERLARGPLPFEEAVRVCRQIARALESAHESGVLHRDLKPANVKVTPDGTVKVLDFGLAKAFDTERTTGVSHLPTATSGGTRDGFVLGTPGYMSPEQARGQPLDRRTDVWSFGCVLYEALTGSRTFPGDTSADTIATVLARDPDWGRLPAAVPAGLRRLLARCLRRERDQRLRDMGDVRLELEEALATAAGESLEPGPPRPQSSRARFWVPWLVAAALAIVAAFALWKPRGAEVAPAARPSRLSVLLPPGDRLAVDARPALAISPDGSLLAYAAERQGAAGLFLRRLDATASTLLPGTEDASHPFFSPDGRWIGFSASRKLKKVSIGGGAPVTICEAVNLRGASWASDDTIVFTPATREGLFRVAAAGGVPQRLTSPDSENRDYDHRWPQVLPDGGILYSKWAPWQGSDARKIWTADPAAREGKPLTDQVEFGRILHNRMLAFVRSGALFVAPFDPETRSLAGPARPLPDSVYVTTNTGAAHFDVSRTGTLAYVPGGPPTDRTLVWRELDGPETPLGAPKRAYLGADLSPDGSRVVVAIEATSRDLWLYDISRRTLTRLTFEGDNAFPIWSPDGRQIAFASREKDGAYNLLRLAADGSQPPERLSRSASTQIPVAFAPDGRFLVFGQARGASQADIYLLPLTGERTPRPLFDSPFDERWGRVSPDGGRIAYVSDESGIDQVYVQSFPNRGGKVQVSTDGGRDPIWSPDGRTLIYTNGDRWLSAGIGPGPAPETSSPRLLFEARYERPPGPLPNYDLSPDGRRILTIKGAAPPDAISQIVVVQNWFDELRRLDSAAARGSRPVP